jgi:4-hydroxy-tetrahydrodipicolinate synthase
MRIHKTVYRVGRYGSSIIKGIKCALSCMGICDDFMAEPFHRFRGPQREAIQKHLVELGILKGG